MYDNFTKRETLLNGKEVNREVEARKKGFNKSKITKTLAGLTLAASLGITGLAIYDAMIDHTEEICPISKLENIILQDDAKHEHQIFAMKNDLIDKGYENAEVSYGFCIKRIKNRATILPTELEMPFAPDGYELKYGDYNEPYCVKRTYLQVAKGEEIPTGFTVYNIDVDGNQNCFRDTYANPIIKTVSTLPLGYTLEYDEQLGRNVGVHYFETRFIIGKGYTIEYEDNIIAHISDSWIHPQKRVNLLVRGTKASAIFDDTLAENKLQIFESSSPKTSKTEVLDYIEIEPLKLECQHFLNCIEQGKPARSDGHNGFNVVKVLEEAEKIMLGEKVKALDSVNFALSRSKKADIKGDI